MNSDRRGFNLIETMAAVFVLTVAIFGVLSVNVFSLRHSLANQNHQIASTLAKSQLGLVETVLKADFHCPSSALGHGVAYKPVDFPNFDVAVTDLGYEDPGSENLRGIQVTVGWTEKGEAKKYALETTFFNY